MKLLLGRCVWELLVEAVVGEVFFGIAQPRFGEATVWGGKFAKLRGVPPKNPLS